MDKKEVFLGKNKSTVSVNKENELSVTLSAKTRVLPYNNIDEKLSLIKLYNSERDACNKYRMIFTINPICTNVLFNAKTEVVRLEGSDSITVMPPEIDVTTSDGHQYKNSNLLNTTQAIRDTEYTHKDFFNGEDPYVYHCGWDIFNNHMLRSNDFVYISKLNGRSAEFNTIRDFLRDKDGNIITEKISPNDSTITTNMHVYQYDNILSMYDTFRNRLDEKNGWYGFINPGNIEIPNAIVNGKEISLNKMMNNNKSCELYELYPDQSLYSFIPKLNKFKNRLEYNWDYDLVYPYENDFDKLGEIVGIPVHNDDVSIKVLRAKKTSSPSGSDFVTFKTMFKHTFKEGDYVRLYCLNNGVVEKLNKRLKIITCGDNNGNNTDRYFSIRSTDLSANFAFNRDGDVVFKDGGEKVIFYYKKDVAGYECKYYIRKFKRVGENRFNSEINKLAFGENIYGDRIAQLIFTDDIDVEGLVDNFGRPLSEVYLYFFKTNRGHDEWYKYNTYSGDTIEFSHCFGEVTSGIDLPSEESDYNVRKLHNVDFIKQNRTTENLINYSDYVDGFQYVYSGSCLMEEEVPKPIQSGLTISSLDNDGFVYGDIVEFDPINYEETVIENIYHRFNTAQRETSNPKYFDIIDDEIKYDDYDVDVNSEANNFEVSANTLNEVIEVSGSTTIYHKYPVNISPEGYFYNPKTVVKLADISENISKVIVKQIKYKENSGFTFVTTYEGVDEYGNDVVGYHGVFSAETKYDFVKGDFIALYQDSNDKIFYGVVSSVSGNMIDVMFSSMPSATAVVNGSAALLTTRDYVAPYAIFLPSSRAFVWRELIKPSDLPTDSTLYDRAFSNGCFYIHQNVNFFLKRQDPRNEFGLLYPEDSNRNTTPQIKNYKKPGNNEVDLSIYDVFSNKLNNICY